MYFHEGVGYPVRASMLVRQLVDEHDPRYGVGSMSCSVYDTAWVAMIAKTTEGKTQWLFPSSFQCLLDQQQHDGGWQESGSDFDSILSSLAALLALCRHLAKPRQLDEGLENLNHRISRAVYYLESKFSRWNAESVSPNSDSQQLVRKLLQMLQREGVEFDFPEKVLIIRAMDSRKLQNKQAALYGKASRATTYALEGLVGEIDFDRVSQHKVFGSMMASPASTAAYLMNCSSWDDEAESYLNHIVYGGNQKSNGGVPAKFPTTVFEITAVIMTLIENGFTYNELGARKLENAAGFLQECLKLDSGITGFAPHVESDADNTARAISTLCLLGQTVSPQGLIDRYETREYFKTYTQDRGPSFRTNCLVLKAFLDLLPSSNDYVTQIEKIVRFLCDCWWTTNGQIEDSSNTSPYYPVMLMTEAFTRLVELWDQSVLAVPTDPLLRTRVTICLFQAMTRTILTQGLDGSWGTGGCETTAYAVITLTKLISLCSSSRVKMQVSQSIDTARRHLLENFRPFCEPDRIWTGKVTSGFSVLRQAYVSAALQAPTSSRQISTSIEFHFDIPLAKMAIQTKYYARQAYFANIPEWVIQACILESYLLLPQLRDVRYAVFPSDVVPDDKHFDTIPFAWIASSNIHSRFIGAEYLYQMTILSALGRQFEHYMEHVVADLFAGCLFEVEDLICGIFYELENAASDQCFCDSTRVDTPRSSTATVISDARSTLYRFISHVINHPYILMASLQDQVQLRSDFLNYLLSSVSQLSGQENVNSSTDQTSHPYIFASLACLVGNQNSTGGVGLRRDFLATPEQQYLAADLCRHVSIMSFMSRNPNEQLQVQTRSVSGKSRNVSFGSDRPCGSISTASTSSSFYDDETSPVSPISSMSSGSVGSPTVTPCAKSSIAQMSGSSSHPTQESLQMSRLLHHERRCLNLCLEGLQEAGIDQRAANIVKLFVDATNLSESIFCDPNIGSTHQPSSYQEEASREYALKPPPVPPKRRTGSVAAARAALALEPLTIKPPPQSNSDEASPATANDRIEVLGSDNRTESSNPAGREWSWNQKPIVPDRSASMASSEVTRIESIMDEIDGIRLEIKTPPKAESQSQRRTASEGDAAWFMPNHHVAAQPRPFINVATNAEAAKLAKVRLETQRKAAVNMQRKTKAESHVREKQASDLRVNSMEDVNKSQIKRRVTCPPESAGWVKAPPSVPANLASMEMQASKLRRASRLGGPRWKAPF